MSFFLETEIAPTCIMIGEKIVRVDGIFEIVDGIWTDLVSWVVILESTWVAILFGCIVPN